MQSHRTWALCALLAAAVVSGAWSADDLFNIPQNTLVKLSITDPVSSRTDVAGKKVNFRVADDVWVGTDVVIRKGETGVATVTRVTRPGGWGKSASVEMEFGPVNAVDGTPVSLGPWSKDPITPRGYAAGASVGGAVVLGPVGVVGGMFVRGKHVELPVGHEVAAAVRWDTAISLRPASRTAAQPQAPAPVEPSAATPAPEAPSDLPSAPVPAAPAVPAASPSTAPPSPPASPSPPAPKAAAPAAPAKPAPAASQAKPAAGTKPAAKPPAAAKTDRPRVAPVIPIIEDVTDEKGGAGRKD